MIEGVKIKKGAIGEIFYRAKLGYEARYKKESIGLLFGKIRGAKVFIKDAFNYGAHRRTRCEINYSKESLIRRGKKLSSDLGLQFLGTYHSHVEEAGKVNIGLSQEDKEDFIDSKESIVELLIAIRTSDLTKPPTLQISISGLEEKTKYRFIVRAYAKSNNHIKLIRGDIVE